jgi:hypothetical protein
MAVTLAAGVGRPPARHTGEVPGWGSYSYAFGPLVVGALLVVLVLLMRWAFSGGSSVVRRNERRPGEPGDYGLLEAVAAPRTETEAEAIRIALIGIQVHATVARTTQGLRVLVWPQDAERAREVVRRLRRRAS